jgi:hypothetical protein
MCLNYGDDAPSSSLMDSIVSLSVQIVEGEGVGARSLVHNISRVKGHVRTPGWD